MDLSNLSQLLLSTTQDTIVAFVSGIFSILPSPTLIPEAVNTSIVSYFGYLYSLNSFLDVPVFFIITQIILFVEISIFIFKFSFWLIKIIRG